jgi:hypothetical protein
MNTKYSKVNGISVKDETVEPNQNGDDDVNNLSETDRSRFKKNKKNLNSFLNPSRKINGSLPENGSVKTDHNAAVRNSYDFSEMHDSATFNSYTSLKHSKNVCLIEESPFYIHKV